MVKRAPLLAPLVPQLLLLLLLFVHRARFVGKFDVVLGRPLMLLLLRLAETALVVLVLLFPLGHRWSPPSSNRHTVVFTVWAPRICARFGRKENEHHIGGMMMGVAGNGSRVGATRLIFVRHGQTEWNAEGRIQGSSDTPLDDAGREQARRAGRRLGRFFRTARFLPAAVYSSDLSRALETARIVREQLPRRERVVLRTTPALRELGYGEWEGKTRAELEAEGWGEALRRWHGGDADALPPGAETKAEADARVDEFLACVVPRHSGETIIIVGHGGSLRLMLCRLLPLSPDEWGRVRLANTSLSEAFLVPGRRPRVTRINDTAHLEAMPGPRLAGPLQGP